MIFDEFYKILINKKHGTKFKKFVYCLIIFHSGCACMEQAAKNTSSEDIIMIFLAKFYKNIKQT